MLRPALGRLHGNPNRDVAGVISVAYDQKPIRLYGFNRRGLIGRIHPSEVERTA